MRVFTNLLGIALCVVVAYFSIHFDARIGEEFDSLDAMRTIIFLFSLATACWFAKEIFADFRKPSKKEFRLCKMKI